MGEAWIIDGVRSPRGRGKKGAGGLADVHPQRVMAQVLNGLKDKVGFEVGDIEDVVAGNGSGTGDHAHDIARSSVLDAGWPINVPGVTLHRFCGSGQQAVTMAAMGIAGGLGSLFATHPPLEERIERLRNSSLKAARGVCKEAVYTVGCLGACRLWPCCSAARAPVVLVALVACGVEVGGLEVGLV